MTPGRISPALRATVDASLAWYDAVCALHGVPCGIADDVWRAYAPPPPLHSTAKTVEPTAGPGPALAAVGDRGSIADSFGAFDLRGEGFRLLLDAQWIHRAAEDPGRRRMPAGWVSVQTPSQLRAWTSRHDTEAVLLPALLQRSAFRLVGRRSGDGFGAGAVLHLGSAVVGVSNVWTTAGLADWIDVVRVATALFPHRSLVGYELGGDLDQAQAAGFTAVGPHRVWIR